MKRFILLLAMLALVMPLAPAKAYILTNHHWSYGNPRYVPVNIASSIPLAWDVPFAHAMSAWNAANARFRFQIGSAGHDLALKYLWFDSALALTYIREGSATITTDRDTDFNSKYSWDVNGDPNKYDAWSTVAHELGHWLTLDDERNLSDYYNTMYFQADKGQTFRRSLEANDLSGIRAIYGTL